MIKFAAQLHGFRKTTIGDNIVSFSVDRIYSDSIKEIVGEEIGTQYIVHLESVNTGTNMNVDPIDLKERFVKKLHALLGQLAEAKGETPKMVKDKLKNYLKLHKIIEESTKELDIKGLAIASNIVQKWLNE